MAEKQKQQNVAKWWNDRTIFWYHFSRSNYVTTSWNWFMMFAGKIAEPFLFTSVLYSGYELLPGVPQPGAMVDAGVFIAQQVALDIGGMGLMKIAQQEKQGKNSFAYRVGFILIGLMIANVVLSMMKKLIPNFGPTAAVIEGVLLIARAIMAVVYGYAIHSLRKEEREPEAIVKSSDVHTRLDQFCEMLRTMSVSTEQRIQQLEANTEQRTQALADTFRSLGHAITETIQQREANTDMHLTERFQLFGESLQQTEAKTEYRLEQIAASTHDQIQAVVEMVQQLGKSYTYTIQEMADSLQAEMHAHLQERLAPVIEQLEDHHQILASLPQHLGQIEEVTQGQLRIVVQEVTLVKTTLEQQTKAFPELAERLIAAPRLTEHAETNIRKLTRVRPIVSVEEEPNTIPNTEANTTPNESDKGEFVRQCLRDHPEIRNADIRRKAEAINLIISPSYISETRKAFFEELNPQNDERTTAFTVDDESDTRSA
jgi:hypothetical protein